MKKNSKISGVVVAVLITFLVTGCSSNSTEVTEEKPIPVKKVEVEKQDLSIPVFTSGRLFPKVQVKLSFKTSGMIKSIHVSEGDVVKKGQLMASLDLSEIQAHYNKANNGYLKAKRDLKRVKNLFEDKAATLEQYQNVKTAYEIAESNLKIAEFNLEYSKITAPSNGKILKQLAEVNEMIGPAMPVFLFGSTASKWVIKAGVSERDIVQISMGNQAKIKFDAYPGKDFSAEVSEISEAVDPTTGTYEVELTMNDESLKLVAGFIAKVNIQPAKTNRYFLIPVDALVEGEGKDGFVFTVQDNKAKKIKIKIAHLFNHKVAVESGLENVKDVITSGSSYLNDGSKIKIVD